MKLLLDTQLLIWASEGSISDGGLSASAVALIVDQENELWFSVASIWEATIKNSLGRKDFLVDPPVLRRGLLDNGYNELSINSTHALAVGQLPNLHKDPFDRILIAQATIEGFTLLTSDSVVATYPGSIRKV